MINQFITILQHPGEWKPLMEVYKKYKAYRPDSRSLNILAGELDDREFCYAALSKVSRSFSVVIRRLPPELRDAVCVFYLVLRGLDSIEDDTGIDPSYRIYLLSRFHRVLHEPHWQISGIGTNEDYRMLLRHFRKVIGAYGQLDMRYQRVIRRICREMGKGMVKYLDKKIESLQDYDEYCYYVAGLVGVGLTELFVMAGLEDTELMHREDLQVAMGQFLQKTNIIRDIREDMDEDRLFWPREVWGLYAERIDDLINANSQEALFGLNHMISDALLLAPKSLEYLRLIRDPGIFQFCAIPQVMAIATLSEIFHNPEVFRRNVKIRKGLAATLFLRTNEFTDVLEVFHEMANIIQERITLDDPNAEIHLRNLRQILSPSLSHTVIKKRKESIPGLLEERMLDVRHSLQVKTR